MLVYRGIPRGRKGATSFFPSLVNRESYSTRAGLSAKCTKAPAFCHTAVKCGPRVGVISAKFSAYSCLFAAHFENEPYEIQLRKFEINPSGTPARYEERPWLAVLYSLY